MMDEYNYKDLKKAIKDEKIVEADIDKLVYYTDYQYTNLIVSDTTSNGKGRLLVSIDVTNSGKVDGAEVVQLYIGFKNSSVDRPVKLLRDFDKVFLKAGETKTVALEVAYNDMAWYNPDTKKWEVEELDYEVYVGSSSAKKDLQTKVFVIEEVGI